MRRTEEEKKDDDDDEKKKGHTNKEGSYNCEKREKEHLATQSARTSWLNSPRKK